MNKAKKVMDLFEFESKYADMAQKIIEKGFKQINKELDDLYKKSKDQGNWFYVGGYTAESIVEGIKLLAENFGYKALPREVAELLDELKWNK